MDEPQRIVAVYNTFDCPTDFSFAKFLALAITRGANHIVFDTKDGYRHYVKDKTEERISSILHPMCALGGCTYSIGQSKDAVVRSRADIKYLIESYRELGYIKKLKSVLPPADVEYTVTIRNQPNKPQRNSSNAWYEFAKEIRATIIEDYDQKKIGLHERMALYAGAKMNFFRPNGPAALGFVSDIPYVCFLHGAKLNYHNENKFGPKDRLPWANDRQICTWEPDTIENIRRICSPYL